MLKIVEVGGKKYELGDRSAGIYKQTLRWITDRERGWPLCQIYPDQFYTRPLLISEYLKLDEAAQVFDYKIVGDPGFVPIRVFLTERNAAPLKPEDRFSPYRITYSYTQTDYDRLMLSAQAQADVRKQLYMSPKCPRLGNEWTERILPHAALQPTIHQEKGKKRKSPKAVLAAYRFVAPEVQVLSLKSPNPKAVFQLRYSEMMQFHFYICYAGGVSPRQLDQWLAGCNVIR